MTATTTRSRTSARPGRRPSGPRSYGGFVDGANALQIGYADPIAPDELDGYALPAEPTPKIAEPDGEPLAAPAPVALPRTSFIVLVAGVVIAAVLGVLVLNTKINENSFTLDNLRTQQAALDEHEQQLSRQLADLESTGNLSAQAARLGLVPAGTPAFLTLPNGKIVGVPQPADGSAGSSTTDPGR